MRRFFTTVATVAILAAGVVAVPPVSAAPVPDWNAVALEGVPRVQWNANYGYCGETSMITAGLRLGQYTSQWTAREVASPRIPQTSEGSQLLLGMNDLKAAKRMKLDAVRAPLTDDYKMFMTWVRQHVAAGDTVIVGVFNNTTELGETPPGDPTYDHIVPVYGYESVTPLTVTSHALDTDMITISDNGLRTVGSQMPMLYSYRVGSLQRTRGEANKPGGPTYSLPAKGPWYGLAVTGVTGPGKVTLPVTVGVNVNSEGLQNQPVLASPPKARPIVLTVTVNRPAGSGESVLYQYDDFGKVPVRDFSKNAGDASKVWRVPAGSGPFTVKVKAMSDDTRVFRAAPVGK